MKSYDINIKPFGKQAILIEWPNEVDEQILEDILQFQFHLKQDHLNELEWEMVAAYNSLTLIHRDGEINFGKFRRELKDWYASEAAPVVLDRYQWNLPVCYDSEFGIDLSVVAQALKTSPEEIIGLHTKHVYTVYGIGFLPGFMYLGGLPKSLETARRAEPRLNVKKGSVGLAGKQTGIYPQDSPGGWNIIGNCPIPIFNINNDNPCFVNVGDRIAFYQINKGQYELHKIEAEVGIYNIEKIKINA